MSFPSSPRLKSRKRTVLFHLIAIEFYSWTKTKQMLILEIYTGDWVHVVYLRWFGVFFWLLLVYFVGFLKIFFNGCMNALIGKLISEVMVLIECYSQPVRSLVCRLSELFEQFNTPPTKTNLNRLCWTSATQSRRNLKNFFLIVLADSSLR